MRWKIGYMKGDVGKVRGKIDYLKGDMGKVSGKRGDVKGETGNVIDRGILHVYLASRLLE